MKKVIAATAFLIVVIIVVAIILRSNLSMVISRAGFNPSDINILYSGIDNNGERFMVIKTSTIEHKIVLGYLTKNNLGFWSLKYTEGDKVQSGHIVSIGWMINAGFRKYDMTKDSIFVTEWHQLYYGDNAIRFIEFLPGEIPDGVAVNIRQFGKEYCIHLITFNEPDTFNKIDIHKLLLKDNDIQD
jgi:hypothetical protein